jgi:cytochrome c oxidase assembly protein subunit 11
MADIPATEHKAPDNRKIVLVCAGITFGMLGLSFAAVPLYDLFCRVTGFGGTTQVSAGNANGIIDRPIATRFDATVPPGMPLRVVPARVQTDPMGTVKTVVYEATNLSSEPLSTTASYNVTPESTGIYFNKIECFCFTEQVLAPGETVEMPVTYFVDPDMDANSELRTIRDITLSYTFYKN